MKLLAYLLALASFAAVDKDSHLGVSLSGVAGPPEARIKIAKELGATWYRPAPVQLLGEAKCDDCAVAQAAALSIALVVRNATAAGKPSATVTDVADFQKRLRAVLERDKPAMLILEDEPDDRANFSGAPDDYRSELSAACEVSRSMKIPCANGGLTSENVALLVIDQRYKSDPQDAANVATTTEYVRVGGPGTDINILGTPIANIGGKQTPVVEATRRFLDKHQHEIDWTRQFIEAIDQAKPDRLNFHWFELQVDNLPKVLDSFHEVSKLDLMCDAMADKSDRAFVIGEKIRVALQNYVWPTIWVGTDQRGILGLVDKKGKPRASATAFQQATSRE